MLFNLHNIIILFLTFNYFLEYSDITKFEIFTAMIINIIAVICVQYNNITCIIPVSRWGLEMQRFLFSWADTDTCWNEIPSRALEAECWCTQSVVS